MRTYVIPFLLGITIGLSIAFLVSSMPDSWVMNHFDYGEWQIPLWDLNRLTYVPDKFMFLTSQALVLRFAAFLIQEGYWYLAIPTLVTCIYTRLRIESRRSPGWDRLFETLDWTLLVSVCVALLMSFNLRLAGENNWLDYVLSRMTFSWVFFILFWISLVIPVIVGSVIFTILFHCDKKQKLPMYRFNTESDLA